MACFLQLEKESGEKLKAKDILEKIRNIAHTQAFDWKRTLLSSHDLFLTLLSHYPESICTREISDKLKLIIALIHEEFTLPADKDYPKELVYLSYETLGIMFGRSKASIFQAIKEKGEEAKRLIEMKQNQDTDQDKAFKALPAQEKARLLEIISKNPTNERTNGAIERE